jgi:uncharacterized protein YjbJ (UPF0337 family)
MNWEHVESNWAECKGKVKHNWSEISEPQLAMIAGNRERLVNVIEDTYGISQQQVEQQLMDWQDMYINIDGHFYASRPVDSALYNA